MKSVEDVFFYLPSSCHCSDGTVEELSLWVMKQEEITLWTGVEDNGSVLDGDGTIGHGLTMDIVRGLSIREHTCYACIAHPETKA